MKRQRQSILNRNRGGDSQQSDKFLYARIDQGFQTSGNAEADGSYHKNSAAYFEIQADDPARAIGFYKTNLGWGFTKATGLPIEYWRIQTEDIRGGLLKRPAPAPPQRSGTNAYVCSMQVEDSDGTAKAILKDGGQVALEKFAVPGSCWQGYFLDPEGNTFGVFQADENAK